MIVETEVTLRIRWDNERLGGTMQTPPDHPARWDWYSILDLAGNESVDVRAAVDVEPDRE